jgi:Fic family protein
MELSAFTKDAHGALRKNLEGNWTFVPHPLPAKVDWNDKLVSAVAEAEGALGKLSGLGQKFPRPRRLVRLFLRREAELSSRIENTFAGVRTQLLFRDVPEIHEKSPDVVEVENNFRALEFGLKAIKDRDLSIHLIRQMHQVLMKDARGHDQTPGSFRKLQAHIGTSSDIRDARFVPPPPHAVSECMEQLEAFIRNDRIVPRVAKLAMAHYQFEAIHPFADGNGRIGRVLILLLMCQSGLLPLPLFNPSAYLERHRREYYDHLLAVSQRGAWVDWLEFFSRGIEQECAETSRRIEALDDLRRSYQERIRSSRASVKLAKLVDELFGSPRLRLDNVAKMLDVWPASAQRYLDKLVDHRILREVTGGSRNRVYLAQEIVEQFSTSGEGKK